MAAAEVVSFSKDEANAKTTATTTKMKKKNSQRNSLTTSLRQSIQSKVDYCQMKPIYKIPLLQLQLETEATTQYKTLPLKKAVQEQRCRQKAEVSIVLCVRQVG